MSLGKNGKDRKLVIKNARMPSASKKSGINYR